MFGPLCHARNNADGDHGPDRHGSVQSIGAGTSQGRSSRAVAAAAGLLLCVVANHACAQTSPNLQDVLVQFLTNGILLARPESGVDHSAHFLGRDSPQFLAITTLNDEISRQLNAVPIPSSAGGFAFEIDPALGIPVRHSQSYGPIYAERALTLGKGKFNLGISHSRYGFDQLDGLDLRRGDISLVFFHSDVGIPDSLDVDAEGDAITADLYLKIQTNVTSFATTYGVTDAIDVGLVIPIVDVDVAYSAVARIHRLSTYASPKVHQFPDGSSERIFGFDGHATGIGDVTLRSKARLVSTARGGLAVMGEVRLPTGDELDLLGNGAYQGRVAVLGALQRGTWSPHLNAGFVASSRDDISDEVDIRAGLDWAVDPKLTIAVDALGRVLLSSNRVRIEPWSHRYRDPSTGNIETTEFPVLASESDVRSQRLELATGFKLNVGGNVLFTTSGLVPLTDDGMLDEFSILAGLDYSF